MNNAAQASKIETDQTQNIYRPTLETTPLKHEIFGDDPVEQKTLDTDGRESVGSYGLPQVGATTWEHLHGVDVLGPEYHYNFQNERIVVDWDDTIKSTGMYWIQAHREVLNDFGFNEAETDDDNILKLFGNIHVANTLGIDRFKKDDKQYSDDDVWNMISGRARQLLAENPIDPLVVTGLKMARQMGVQFAVWSSSPRELITEAIEANDLSDVFADVIGVDDVDPDKHKPDPQGFIMAVHAMDVAAGYLQPDEPYSDEKPLDVNGVWMVGDSPNDILGGKAVGASTVWLENPLQGHNAHEKRRNTIKAMAKKAGSLVVEEAVESLRPTLVARTFDPEQAGFGRNVPMSDMPMEAIRKLAVTNYNFAHFLIDRNSRALLHRREAVTAILEKQDILSGETWPVATADGILDKDELLTNVVDSSVYGNELSGVRRLKDRKFGPIKSADVHRTLASILARDEGPWV